MRCPYRTDDTKCKYFSVFNVTAYCNPDYCEMPSKGDETEMMWPVCSHPERCKHYVDYRSGKDEGVYDYCHQCAMEHDYFEPKEEEKQNERRML